MNKYVCGWYWDVTATLKAPKPRLGRYSYKIYPCSKETWRSNSQTNASLYRSSYPAYATTARDSRTLT